jgi:hypothetical protein
MLLSEGSDFFIDSGYQTFWAISRFYFNKSKRALMPETGPETILHDMDSVLRRGKKEAFPTQLNCLESLFFMVYLDYACFT